MSGPLEAWDRDRAVRRLGELVTTETPSGDAARLLAAYELIAEWGTKALGRAPETVVEDGVPHLLWGAARPRVLLLCHADTVFPAGTVGRRPFRVDGDRATGPGVFDMKAGIVAGLDALELVGVTDEVALLVTGDEETGSRTSRGLIESVAAEADAVLVMEPSLGGALKVGRKGGAFYDITFRGLAAHAGLEPELGRNALLELARWAVEVPRFADPVRGTTVTPTRASAGTALNVVPDLGTLTVDVRALTIAEMERVDAALRGLVHGAADGVAVEIAGGINRPPLEAADSVELVALCRAQARRLGQPEPGTATVGGGSDGNFTSALGIPTVDGLGPAGDGAHAEHEWVSIPAIGERALLVAAMVEALTPR
ncbi:MAG: M20 family metallopeptidase [Nocardioidaceae bacterium]|nr:M20 family metallopeptidase [Nocardioidaceae bacterium]